MNTHSHTEPLTTLPTHSLYALTYYKSHSRITNFLKCQTFFRHVHGTRLWGRSKMTSPGGGEGGSDRSVTNGDKGREGGTGKW